MKNTIQKLSISMAACNTMIDAAIAKAHEIGFEISITIVDESGNTKVFCRMDNAALMSMDASKKKAITAVGLGLSTGKAWHDFIKDDPILNQGVNNIKDFILLGGGAPIVIDGRLVGAVGVSGGHYSQDEQCMDAALGTL